MRSIRSSRIVHVFFACTESLQSATVSSVLVEFAEDGERRRVSECKAWRLRTDSQQKVVFSSLKAKSASWLTGVQTDSTTRRQLRKETTRSSHSKI